MTGTKVYEIIAPLVTCVNKYRVAGTKKYRGTFVLDTANYCILLSYMLPAYGGFITLKAQCATSLKNK